MNKIKVKLVADEWYPVYDEAKPNSYQYSSKKYELSVDLWKRYHKAFVQFSKVRDELNEALITSQKE